MRLSIIASFQRRRRRRRHGMRPRRKRGGGARGGEGGFSLNPCARGRAHRVRAAGHRTRSKHW